MRNGILNHAIRRSLNLRNQRAGDFTEKVPLQKSPDEFDQVFARFAEVWRIQVKHVSCLEIDGLDVGLSRRRQTMHVTQ
jgi:hypothetical protein